MDQISEPARVSSNNPEFFWVYGAPYFERGLPGGHGPPGTTVLTPAGGRAKKPKISAIFAKVISRLGHIHAVPAVTQGRLRARSAKTDRAGHPEQVRHS